jgi:hypothetical protein
VVLEQLPITLPASPVRGLRRTGGQIGRGDAHEGKKPASEQSGGTIRAMLETARGLPDLLKARRSARRWTERA